MDKQRKIKKNQEKLREKNQTKLKKEGRGEGGYVVDFMPVPREKLYYLDIP